VHHPEQTQKRLIHFLHCFGTTFAVNVTTPKDVTLFPICGKHAMLWLVVVGNNSFQVYGNNALSEEEWNSVLYKCDENRNESGVFIEWRGNNIC